MPDVRLHALRPWEIRGKSVYYLICSNGMGIDVRDDATEEILLDGKPMRSPDNACVLCPPEQKCVHERCVMFTYTCRRCASGRRPTAFCYAGAIFIGLAVGALYGCYSGGGASK
jgi:hypothetical protein